jgi:hypothetical protein
LDSVGDVGGLGSSTSTSGPLSLGSDIGEITVNGDRPVTDDLGEITITDDRPTTDVPVDDMGEITITDVRINDDTETDDTKTDDKITTTTTSNPITVTLPKTVAAPLSSAPFTDQKLNSNPQFLTSAMVKNKKILRDLQQLFGTLTPELVGALAERGVVSPQMAQEFQIASLFDDAETQPQESGDKNLETKFVADGGSIASKIDPKFSVTSPLLLPAAPVLDNPSRLGALRHMRDSLSNRGIGGLAHGGLPHKYVEATPKGHKPEFITGLTGYYASGAGTGQSDDIDAILHDGDYVADADLVAALGDGSSKAGAEALEKFRRQVPHQEHAEGGQPVPAKIADGEYVFPASFVTAIGRGDNKEGAKILDKMREAIRAHKRSAPTSKIPPKAKSPLDYLKMVKG